MLEMLYRLVYECFVVLYERDESPPYVCFLSARNVVFWCLDNNNIQYTIFV